MTFFQNEPESEQTTPSASSVKGQPLFRQDPGQKAGRHVSLSTYISQHLESGIADRSAEPASTSKTRLVPGSGPLLLPTPLRQSVRPTRPGGHLLNSLDVDMPGGLEQYLPTPMFRLRVMKRRLDTEIAELRMKLHKYERLAPQVADMQPHIQAVRERLRMLEAHEVQVRTELEAMLAGGSFWYGLTTRLQAMTRWMQANGTWIGQWLGRLLYGSAYQSLAQAGDELGSLRALLVERLGDQDVSEAEVGLLMNRYEQAVRRMETAALGLQGLSLPRRLWQEARRLVQ